MSRLHMALGYSVTVLALALAVYLYGSHRAQRALLEQQIERLTGERDVALGNYARARATVIRDTIVVRQTVTKWKDAVAAVPDVTLPEVRELVDAGNDLAAQCAQFIDHTEAFVVSADSLNLAHRALEDALGKRKTGKLEKIATITVSALAGIGLGAIVF